jgi:hypothetical protein
MIRSSRGSEVRARGNAAHERPPGAEPRARRNRFKSPLSFVEAEIMDDIYPYPAFKNVKVPEHNFNWKIENQTLKELCEESVENPEFAEAADFSYFQKMFAHYSNNDNAETEKAIRYFLSYIMSRGYAPMNFANARGQKYEYGPITKYGTRPQEIIENIIADWRSRDYKPFELYEVMFGWEHDCGLFMEDDPE